MDIVSDYGFEGVFRLLKLLFVVFFFFKQKTAYEIKECDWSSDVCSSDLSLPDRFVSIASIDFGDCFQGGNLCAVQLKNWGERDADIHLRLTVAQGEATETTVSVPAKSEAEAELLWTLQPGDDGATVRLTVVCNETLLRDRAFRVSEVPAVFGTPPMLAYYLEPHAPVIIRLPVRIGQAARGDASLSWQAISADGTVVGEGVTVPMRVRFDDLDDALRPRSGSASFSQAWQGEDEGHEEIVAETIERWRRQIR